MLSIFPGFVCHKTGIIETGGKEGTGCFIGFGGDLASKEGCLDVLVVIIVEFDIAVE